MRLPRRSTPRNDTRLRLPGLFRALRSNLIEKNGDSPQFPVTVLLTMKVSGRISTFDILEIGDCPQFFALFSLFVYINAEK
jgi:hypothetical protein